MDEKVVMIGEKRFVLPFIDLLSFREEQNKSLGDDIEQSGEVLVPVVCWKEKKKSNEETVIDGAHRIEWASKYGIDKVPIRYMSCDSDLAAKAACYRLNYPRRHLPTDQLSKAREDRIAVIAELVAKGATIRAAAEVTGVSPTQVQKDIKRSGVPSPRAQNLCKRCKRVGPVKDCEKCTQEAKRKARKKERSAPSNNGIVDAFKNPVPKNRKTALCDPWIQNAIDTIAEVSESFRMAGLINTMNKRAAGYPFFDPKDFVDGCGFVINYLDQLLSHLKDNRPEAVCPKCSGAGCQDCRSSGLVPRRLYAELKK